MKKIVYKSKVYVEATTSASATANKYIVEVLFDDHTSYYSITKEQIQEVLKAKSDDERHQIVVDNGESVQIRSDVEVDLILDSSGFDHGSWKEHKRLWEEKAKD